MLHGDEENRDWKSLYFKATGLGLHWWLIPVDKKMKTFKFPTAKVTTSTFCEGMYYM